MNFEIMNICVNFILHKTILCNDIDLPSMTKQNKTFIAKKKCSLETC